MTMQKIGLVTTDIALVRDHDPDTAVLLRGLTEAGFRAEAPVWHDPAVDWTAFDLLVLRSPWDYPERYAEFTAWLGRTAAGGRVLNDPELIGWNIDKRYLGDLQELGIECVPFTFCTTPAEAGAAIARLADRRVVVKPTVSAGARDTGLFQPDDPGAAELAAKILADGRTVMVQPAVEAIVSHGENALFFLNGEYAYACHKGPILRPGGGFLGGEYTEHITRADPSAAEIDLGHRTIAAVGELARRRGFGEDAALPLYARIDIASPADAPPQIIEVELFEPSYFVDIVPEATDHFVEAVRRRCGPA